MFILITHFPMDFAALTVVCFTFAACFIIRKCNKCVRDSISLGWNILCHTFLVSNPCYMWQWIVVYFLLFYFWPGVVWLFLKLTSYGFDIWPWTVWENLTESYLTISIFIMMVCLKQCQPCSFMVPQLVHTLAEEAFQIGELRDSSHSRDFNSMTELRNHRLLYSVFSLGGTCGGTVGWGTVLQARRLRVQFLLVSLNFSLT